LTLATKVSIVSKERSINKGLTVVDSSLGYEDNDNARFSVIDDVVSFFFHMADTVVPNSLSAIQGSINVEPGESFRSSD